MATSPFIEVNTGNTAREDVQEKVSESQSIRSLPPVNTINNDFLLQQGIKDDAPEILMVSNFDSMYTKGGSNGVGTVRKNSFFDFVNFQNQFDLTIKESLTQEYKSVLKKFSENKISLETFYLNVINIFEIFSLEENLKSKIKSVSINMEKPREENTTTQVVGGVEIAASAAATQVTGVSALGDSFASLSQQAAALGFDFSETYLIDFFESHSSRTIQEKDKKLTGNSLYKNLILALHGCYFGIPNFSFSSSPSFNYDSIKYNTEGESNFAKFVREIIVFSRGSFLNFGNQTRQRLLASLEDLAGMLTNSATYDSWSQYGHEVLGGPTANPGGVKVFDKANLYTSDQKDIQVFNQTIDLNEPSFLGDLIPNKEALTGRTYFSRDLSSRILNNNIENSDMENFANSVLSTAESFKTFMKTLQSKSDINTRYFNGVIREVAQAAISVLSIDKMTSNSAVITNDGRDICLGLFNIATLGDPEFDGFSGIYASLLSREEFNEKKTQEQFSKFDVKALVNPDLNQQQEGNEFETDVSGPVSFDLLEAIEDEIEKKDFCKNGYLPSDSCKKIALKILKYIFEGAVIYYYEGAETTYFLINDKGLESLYVIQDIVQDKNPFENTTGKFNQKILGKNRPDVKDSFNRVRKLYKSANYGLYFSYNIIESLTSYFSDITKQLGKIEKNVSDINSIFELDNFLLENTGMPSVERLTGLNISYKSIFSPTNSFNENPSYFPYKNTRTSNDLIAINSFHKTNARNLIIDDSFEGMRIAAVGIPSGLINRLRLMSGRRNKHTIIEISLLSLDHKYGNNGRPARFTCRYRFLFNTCLHVNTINPNVDIIQNVELEDFSFENILNVDNRQGFEDFDLNEENLLSFNFGKINDKEFKIDTFRTFDGAIAYNQTYKIESVPKEKPEYTFNSAMSGNIIKNHVIDYILKKDLEQTAGTSFDESIFSYFDSSFISEGSVSGAGRSLISYFEGQPYTDDLKDYLKRSVATSPIINPESFLISSYNISKFDRVFLLPCFKSRSKVSYEDENLSYEDQFSFKSLIPVVRLL
jgi:hypothetical protein